MNKKCILSAMLSLFLVSGCQSYYNKTQDTLPIGTFAIDDVTVHVTNLVVNQMLPDDNTISVMFIKANEAKEKLLCTNVADNLIKRGYAVERVLPKEERQEGDVSEMTVSGVPLIVNFVQLTDSNNFNLTVILNGIKYYRLYALTGGQMIPVSPWSKAHV